MSTDSQILDDEAIVHIAHIAHETFDFAFTPLPLVDAILRLQCELSRFFFRG